MTEELQSYLGLASKGPPDGGLDKLASPGSRSDPTPRRAVVRDMDSRCLPTHTVGESALSGGALVRRKAPRLRSK